MLTEDEARLGWRLETHDLDLAKKECFFLTLSSLLVEEFFILKTLGVDWELRRQGNCDVTSIKRKNEKFKIM